jgi:hypothetical protein
MRYRKHPRCDLKKGTHHVTITPMSPYCFNPGKNTPAASATSSSPSCSSFLLLRPDAPPHIKPHSLKQSQAYIVAIQMARALGIGPEAIGATGTTRRRLCATYNTTEGKRNNNQLQDATRIVHNHHRANFRREDNAESMKRRPIYAFGNYLSAGAHFSTHACTSSQGRMTTTRNILDIGDIPRGRRAALAIRICAGSKHP